MEKNIVNQNDIKTNLANKLAKTLNISVAEALELIPDDKVIEQRVLESELEVLIEAQSVIYFIETKGRGFKKETCKTCLREFVFSYHYDGIKQCSIECMSKALEILGLTWTPNKPLEQRWGRIIPAIVPAKVLDLLGDLDDFLESV